jgi:hypothetical protein
MLESHRRIFFEVAQKHTCWIGLREPNALSDQWIDRPGFRPPHDVPDAVSKGSNCAAKTADNPDHPLAGLVVSPVAVPNAFLPGSLRRALDAWNEFAPVGQPRNGFTVDKDGKWAGCVRISGRLIHSDYDLMTICRGDQNGGFVAMNHLRAPGPTNHSAAREELEQLSEVVIRDLNAKFQFCMVQHGPEFLYNGVGAKPLEYCYWFGPGNRFEVSLSSMNKNLPH